MNPAQALIIAELLVKYGPGLARAVIGIFQKEGKVEWHEWEDVFDLAETDLRPIRNERSN